MSNTPILNIPQVASGQNQKEITINTGLAILEAAGNDKLALTMSGGNLTVTVDQFTKTFHLVFNDQTAVRVVTIPATKRFFAITNLGDYALTIHCSGSSGADLSVPSGARVLALSDGTDVVAVTAGISLLSDLTDVIGALAAGAGQLLGYDAVGETWGPVDAPHDHAFFVEGAPTGAQKVYRHIFTRNARVFSDFSGSQVLAETASTAAKVFNVYKNATLVGTLSFGAAGTSPTMSTDTGSGATSITFAPGDRLTVTAPAVADATLADIAFNLKGVYL